MTILFVQRVGHGLFPDGDESIAAFEKIPAGKPIRCEVKQPRNVRFHRLYFALCQRIGDGVGLTSENVSDLFKIATGHVTKIKTKRGIIEVPKSIAFNNLDDLGFREFFNNCMRVAFEEWGLEPDAFSDLLDQGFEVH